MEFIDQNEISFRIAKSSQEVYNARRLCHDVYFSLGFLRKEMKGKVIPNKHEAHTIYLVAINNKNDVVGTLSITEGRFKTLTDWKGEFYDNQERLIDKIYRTKSIEIGALAVRDDYRKKNVSWGLYKLSLKYSLAMKFEYAIIGMDKAALKSLEDLGWDIVKIGKPMEYFGSLTVPAILPIRQQLGKVAGNNVGYHDYLAA